LNQLKGEPNQALLDVIKKEGLELAGTIGVDQSVYDFDLAGTPTINLPEDAAVVKEAFAIFDKIIP
ncbi:MAG: carbon monoxide dehydrogenase, partial [Deltaproteobacteria bacterium]|nr:carbon monoxide dehydrogenase [Deltaproteobacteria bacterium]